jgi:hypothetical protein
VKGNTVTSIVDCVTQQNRPLPRKEGDTLATSGVIVVGQQIEDNTFLEVLLYSIM